MPMQLIGGLTGVMLFGLFGPACDGDGSEKSGAAGGAGRSTAGRGGTANAGQGQGGKGGRNEAGCGSSGQAAAAGRGGTGAASGAAGDDGGITGGGVSNSGAGGDGGASSDDELSHVFNLVDADAAAELEAYLVAGEGTPHPLSDPGPLLLGVNGFLDAYEEDYDFLFLTTDHEVNTRTYGLFHSVNLEIIRGTGNDIGYLKPGYKSNGRLKGAVGLNFVPGGFGPFGHEILHYWANHLDPSFGFGVGLDFNSKGHWGYADIHGQLGGFDPAALECETPAGAKPPACDPTTGGRYRYVAPFFAPNANGVSIPYAPFELYLMGLVPPSEVPEEIHLLENGEQIGTNNGDGTMILEADGIKTVPLADIIARHGEVTPLPPNRRAFKLAMVVVSANPAPPAVLAEVAHNGAIFGNRASDPELPSFESLTGGRATLDTRLGERRRSSDPAPEYVPYTCDVIAQDCEPDGAACYLNGQERLCALTQGVQAGEPCDSTGSDFDCAAGLECVYDMAGTSTYCSPFCDPTDSGSPIYCPSICPDYIVLGTPEGDIIAGRCRLK
jgi:hypothetical protein